MLNLHRILYSEMNPVSFHAELLPTDLQRAQLTNAKNEIRDHLRTVIADASTTVFKMTKRVSPRFRTQGSWSYRTCVRPAHMPPQEMDWDLGVYLPATFFQGAAPPFAAKAYFDLVENSLALLCKKKGWRLATGVARKDSCIRVHISDIAHIDIPLYAAPEYQFQLITERLMASSSSNRRQVFASDDMQYLGQNAERGELVDFPWDELEHIMLARRTGDWKASDPFGVTRWFADRIAEYGEPLRRLCRYLKAWRDFQWPNGGGPSSLLLMICAVEDFERRLRRDDLLLLDAADRMSTMLSGDVYVAGIDRRKENFNPLSGSERLEAVQKAEALRSAIQRGRELQPSQKHTSIVALRSALGTRVPNREDLVEIETDADGVRSTRPLQVAAPTVVATRSG